MTYALYLLTTLIWSSTWLAIKFQLGGISPLWSVTYRFCLAAIILLVFCVVTRRSLRFSRQDHLFLILQGVFMFGINYILFYFGSQYLISGLVAVFFAGIVVFNIIFSRIFLRTPFSLQVIAGASFGMLGLCLVFWTQLQTLSTTENLAETLLGLVFCFGGTITASIGNVVASRQQKHHLPIIQTNALGMCYGTVFVLLCALLWGGTPGFDWQLSYVSSLLYLALFGSVFAFGAYVSLIKRIGSERAAYSFVVIPLLALVISTVAENFSWRMSTLLGLGLVMLGNALVLIKGTFFTQILNKIWRREASASEGVEMS